MTMLDIQRAQDDQLVSLDLVQVHQLYQVTTHTHITIAMREQAIYVISHHVQKCLEAMVTWPVKTCSSDQTVTPLIRVGSDWRLWNGK